MDDLANWEKKRRRTVYVYFLFAAVYGIDYSIMGITLIPYLQDFVPDGKANYYYSLASIMYYVSSTLNALCLGRIVDRTRNVKYSLYFALVCFGFGQILYTLRFSPPLIVVGRGLSGIILSQDYVLRGELIRCFDEEGASKVLWWYTIASTIGFIFGSWINLAFKGINFQVGEWKIDHHNFGGLMMLVVCVVNLVFVFFFAHDCSKEYDLKSFTDKEKMGASRKNVDEVYRNQINDDEFDVKHVGDESSEIDVKVETSSSPDILDNQENISSSHEYEDQHRNLFKVLYAFIRSSDIMLMMLSTLISVCAQNSADFMWPIIILEIFEWSPKYLNISLCATSIGMVVVLILMSKFVVSSKQIYIALMLVTMSSFVAMVLLMVMIQCALTSVVQIAIFVVYAFSDLPLLLLDSVIIPNILGRMVNTDYQSFVESCRSIMSLISCVTVGIFIASDGYLKYLLFVLVGFILIILFIFFYRRKRMIDVQLYQF